MRRYLEILEALGNFPGSVQVRSFDPETREVVTAQGTYKLSPEIKDTPKPGFNYAFEIQDDQITQLMSLTVDNVITDGDSILLIKRARDPFAGHWALPGGFIDPGETPEQAAKRELQEETGVDISGVKMSFIGKFDKPHRDPRLAHVISYAYQAQIPRQAAQAGDDASAAQWVDLKKLPGMKLAFDHADIIARAKLRT